jgi:serine O-acetyltransferase
MIDFLRAYKNYDPAAKSILEIALLYPGPRAIFFHRIAHFFYSIRFYFIARLFSELARAVTGIEIHPGATIGKRVVIDHGIGTVIGETAQVGDDCIIFHGVTLGGLKFNPGKRHPTLSRNVLVGAGAKILGPVLIGEGTRIGANSVVIKDLLPHSVVFAQPPVIKEGSSTEK